MKKLTLTGAGLLLVLAFAACCKEVCKNDEKDCQLIPAKIIRYDCDRVIFELLTTESIGDAVWVDGTTGSSYTNVVSYYNTCKIGGLTKGSKDTLYVRVKKTNANLTDGNCYQCLAISQDPPQTKVDFYGNSKDPLYRPSRIRKSMCLVLGRTAPVSKDMGLFSNCWEGRFY